MKGGVVETKTRPSSRWDALRSNNDDARAPSGSPLTANSAKDRRKLPYNTQTQYFSSNSSSADWRRSSSNKNISNQKLTNKSSTPISQTALSPQETRIRKAIDKLGNAMKNDSVNCNSTAAKIQNTTTGQQLLKECIAELNIAFFATSDPIFLKRPLHQDLDRNMPLSKVSNDMKWDAIYSLLQLFCHPKKSIFKL